MSTPDSLPPLRYAIIGCGLIGRKRAQSLRPGQLAVACDLDLGRAEALARDFKAPRAVARAEEALADPAVQAVIISTLNSTLAPLMAQAVAAGKHVLVEKPAGLRAADLTPIREAAEARGLAVRVGFNHRFHPALQKARAIIDSGELGALMFMRGRYGHGGRLGYDKEWRADPALSGGGELIDQGVHLIDLARWYFGADFPVVEGHAATYFWDMAVDDNAFLNLRTAAGQTAWLHVSCTEWKNLFSLEIYGRDGKLAIDGLGGSYGLERLAYYRMLPQMGPPETTTWEYPRGDQSWSLELAEFERDIIESRPPAPGLADAEAVLRVVEQIYRASGYAP